MDNGVVIVGAGTAGFQAAFSLRAEGYSAPITIFGEEEGLPYHRPPLSKGCLSGKQDLDDIDLRPASFYGTQNIRLRTGERILAIQRVKQCVDLESGDTVHYDRLILATGASNRKLTVPGGSLQGVCYLRTRADAAILLEQLESANRVAVVGGGFIGLEVAAAATAAGKNVFVIEPQARLMQRAVGPSISEYFRLLHARHGVTIQFGEGCLSIDGDHGAVEAITLTESGQKAVDLVVVGIGVIPRTELAEAAGLPVSNGIIVDKSLRTIDERIYAIGDCAAFPSRYASSNLRLESIQNAVDQARCVAAAILGRSEPYDAVPWFWTDQFEAKLQMAGLSNGFDREATRGDISSGKFSICYFKQGQLIAIDSVNRPGDHLAGRKLIAGKRLITPEQAADPTFDLKPTD